MSPVVLSPFDFFKGISNLIVVIIQVIIGLKLVLKYPKFKDKTFLYMGLSWMLVVTPYLSTVVSFLYTAITGELLSFTIYILLNIVVFPVAVLLWLLGLTNLAFPNQRNLIRILFALYAIVFEVLFFVFLFTLQKEMLGHMTEPFIPQFGPFIIVNYVLMLIILIISGVSFSASSLKSNNEKVALKGKFLLIAFIFLIFGSFFDLVPTPDFVVLIKRIFMILSSVFFYLGFYLPKFLETRLISE